MSYTQFAREDVGLCPSYSSNVEECNLFTSSHCSIRFKETTSFQNICSEIMYHLMLRFPVQTEQRSCSAAWRDFTFLLAQSLRIRSAAFINPSIIGSQKLYAAKWLQFSNTLKQPYRCAKRRCPLISHLHPLSQNCSVMQPCVKALQEGCRAVADYRKCTFDL